MDNEIGGIMNIPTIKKNLFVETIFASPTYYSLDVVKQHDTRILIKTWRGFVELNFDKERECWMVGKEYGKELPEEWRDFVVWEE